MSYRITKFSRCVHVKGKDFDIVFFWDWVGVTTVHAESSYRCRERFPSNVLTSSYFKKDGVLSLLSPEDLDSSTCVHTRGRKRGEILNDCYLFRELGLGKIDIRGKSNQEALASGL